MNYTHTQTLTPGAGTPCEGGVADEARVALPAPAARVARGTAARDLARHVTRGLDTWPGHPPGCPRPGSSPW